jgi:hypothetical protein
VIITLVFMHLIEQQASPRLVVLSALSLAMLLIGLVALDAATRDPEAPQPDLPKSGIDQARSRSS